VNPELIDPAELTAAMPRDRGRLMLGLDVDGVLAPIVSRAERSELLPGVLPVLRALAHYFPIAIVSGRSVADLEHLYAFPGDVVVVGSHGLETRGGPSVELDDDERARLDMLRRLAREAEVIAGAGAWVEQKPASAVLHVRQASEERGRLATKWLVDKASAIEGGHVKTGHAVVELLARTTSKADAVERLRHHYGRAVVAFAGDDLTDEEVFAGLRPHDFGVRVGSGTTAARYRLEGPPQVLEWLSTLLRGFAEATDGRGRYYEL
jgi:trehalose 6-phosphate phosphatase